MTHDQLLTVLKEAKSIINSQPFVYVGDDINSDVTLTPAHFLSLNPKIGLPYDSTEEELDKDFKPTISSAETLILIWNKGMKHVNKSGKYGKMIIYCVEGRDIRGD